MYAFGGAGTQFSHNRVLGELPLQHWQGYRWGTSSAEAQLTQAPRHWETYQPSRGHLPLLICSYTAPMVGSRSVPAPHVFPLLLM